MLLKREDDILLVLNSSLFFINHYRSLNWYKNKLIAKLCKIKYNSVFSCYNKHLTRDG